MSFRPFRIGHVCATPGALAACPPYRMAECLMAHCSGQWGECDAHDCAVNDEATRHGQRILSAWRIDPGQPFEGDNRLWLITEADRSVTTALLPEEY